MAGDEDLVGIAIEFIGVVSRPRYRRDNIFDNGVDTHLRRESVVHVYCGATVFNKGP